MKVKITFEISKKVFDRGLELGPKGSLRLAIKDSIRVVFDPWNKRLLKNFKLEVSE